MSFSPLEVWCWNHFATFTKPFSKGYCTSTLWVLVEDAIILWLLSWIGTLRFGIGHTWLWDNWPKGHNLKERIGILLNLVRAIEMDVDKSGVARLGLFTCVCRSIPGIGFRFWIGVISIDVLYNNCNVKDYFVSCSILCSCLEHSSLKWDWGLRTIWFKRCDNASPIVRNFIRMLIEDVGFQTIHCKTNKLKEDKDWNDQQLCCFPILELQLWL